MAKLGRPPHNDYLTPAEWRVLHAARHGLSNRAIAERMEISVNAIKYHIRNILDKTGLPNKKSLRTYKQQSNQLDFNKPETGAGNMNTANNIQGIGQIARTVSNIETSKNWYELILELPHLYTFGTMAFFDCNGTRLMLNQAETFNVNESILYFSVANIVASIDQLEQKGVEIMAAPHKIHQHDDGTEEWMAFFRDPDDRPLAFMSRVKG